MCCSFPSAHFCCATSPPPPPAVLQIYLTAHLLCAFEIKPLNLTVIKFLCIHTQYPIYYVCMHIYMSQFPPPVTQIEKYTTVPLLLRNTYTLDSKIFKASQKFECQHGSVGQNLIPPDPRLFCCAAAVYINSCFRNVQAAEPTCILCQSNKQNKEQKTGIIIN